MISLAALEAIWAHSKLPHDALRHAVLSGQDPVLPSSFAVGCAAQSSIAAGALAASTLGVLRGQPTRTVTVDMKHAALECTGWFSLNGRVPQPWDKFSGLYRCSDGWLRIHANFAHHRDGALRLLGLNPSTAERADAERALASWRALDFEQAAADHGLVVAACRSFREWDGHAQGKAVAAQPLLRIEQIGEAPPRVRPTLHANQRPLAGLRVLDLTRILAGPVGGRALATYGADVMLINSPHLPNIESIADTSRGKLSAHVDLRTPTGRAALEQLVSGADVFVQGYRPGGIAALGFGPAELARMQPGIVCVSLSAYGSEGPWRERRGFDSLVQAASGFNQAEAEAAGSAAPKPLPMQILDYATGHLMAFAAAAALYRQATEGGSWHASLSLAQTGHWLRGLGRVENAFAIEPPNKQAYLRAEASGFGELLAITHSARFSRDTEPSGQSPLRPSMPPGSHVPAWP